MGLRGGHECSVRPWEGVEDPAHWVPPVSFSGVSLLLSLTSSPLE